jgi:hypothetical protein
MRVGFPSFLVDARLRALGVAFDYTWRIDPAVGWAKRSVPNSFSQP